MYENFLKNGYREFDHRGTLGYPERSKLKGQCHEDFAVLGLFCAKIINLRL